MFVSFYDFQCWQYLIWQILNMYAMMQCKAKSEKLAHILGYQFWAVTNLPPLQESRPEIPGVGRGKRETWQPLTSTIFSIPR